MIQNIENSEKLPPDLDAWKLKEDNLTSLIKLSFKPGEKIEEHKNPLKVIFYVLKGTVEINIDSIILKMEEGDIIEVEANANRG